MPREEEARAIKQRHGAELLRQPGVVGIGIEKAEGGGYLLTIHLDPTYPETRARLPRAIEGCPVKLVESGPFEKHLLQAETP